MVTTSEPHRLNAKNLHMSLKKCFDTAPLFVTLTSRFEKRDRKSSAINCTCITSCDLYKLHYNAYRMADYRWNVDMRRRLDCSRTATVRIHRAVPSHLFVACAQPTVLPAVPSMSTLPRSNLRMKSKPRDYFLKIYHYYLKSWILKELTPTEYFFAKPNAKKFPFKLKGIENWYLCDRARLWISLKP